MSQIKVLDQTTIDQIAAGEVVERPGAVVKELVENAIDAGASAITVEIREGGKSFIRITDNGSGIGKEDISLAFLRHSTSKIRSVEDLLNVSSLGFRGEALSSIAAVSQVELVTKTREELCGNRYLIEGGREKSLEEIGCPNGTTFVVRSLFYNTPARQKFLKSAMTEAGYVNDFMERISVAHPGIAFKFINNNQVRIQTSGNNKMQDVIYHIYGREICSNMVEVSSCSEHMNVTGFIGKPVVSRGNRNYENFYINGRYIKSSIISKAIEEAYKPYTMTHRYPFTVLLFQVDSEWIDVNVHPTKMEIRFKNPDEIYKLAFHAILDTLSGRELIPDIALTNTKKEEVKIEAAPEPFEKKRKENFIKEKTYDRPLKPGVEHTEIGKLKKIIKEPQAAITSEKVQAYTTTEPDYGMVREAKQLNLFEHKLLSEEARKEHRIIGQVFSTYWIVEYQDKMFLIDQHAAHEKVLYERNMKMLKEQKPMSQMLEPPLVLTLSMREEEILAQYMEFFIQMGFEIEHFGGMEYTIRSVPADLRGIGEKELFLELIDSLEERSEHKTPEILLEKVASMSCKAAVKGNRSYSYAEAEALIDELLTLENPYHCPHGRPTIISMSKKEIEKKFKRIV